MDVRVERFQRRRIVSDKSSPMLYYLRQKGSAEISGW